VKIVIDVGCARYGGDYSIERLIELFEPDILYGFDPAWQDGMYVAEEGCKTSVVVSNEVAWIRSGAVHFLEDGLNGQVGEHDHWPFRTCFDLARFIKRLPVEDEIILKMDCEGSEYELLEHLMHTGVDERLSLAWVEWHPRGVLDPAERRASIERRIRCPLDEWLW
jgi:hypothetical protein